MADSPRSERGDVSESLQVSPLVAVQGILRSSTIALTASSVLLLALVFNRFVVDEVANSQSRSDLLATAAIAIVALNALSSLDIESRVADTAELIGAPVDAELGVDGTEFSGASPYLRWLGQTLLECTPTSSVLVYVREGDRTLLRSGLMGTGSKRVKAGAILEKSMAEDVARGTYLASLQNYPGKLEFSYLPANTQCVFVQPFAGGAGCVVLGANAARCYTNKHLTRVQLLADRLGEELGLAG